MSAARVFDYPFATIGPLYVQKVARQGRTAQELDAALGWLTGYDPTGLQRQIAARVDLRGFFASAPALHPERERERERITGVVCGVRVEAIDDPLLRLTRQMDKLLIRQMDKLVDELAKGKPLAKALRA